MLESLVRFLLLPCRSNNVRNIGNQPGEIMISFTKKDLEFLYNKFKSVRKISKEFNIPKSTLNYYFKKFDIDTSKKVKIKKADLKKLYKELGSVYKISDRLGLPPSTVYNYISRYDIDITRKRFPYTKDELIKLYNEFGSIIKVAVELSRNYSTVQYWFKELDIPTKDSGLTIFQKIRNTPMSSTQKSVIIGSLLGDGGIWLAPHSKNARLYVSHCEKQLGYLKWLHSVLQPFSRKITPTEKAGKKRIGNRIINNSNFYRFFTIAHPDITELFYEYYRNGLKSVNNSIIDKVDLIAMAVWFGDDGSIQRNKKREPVSGSIATNSFNYKEQLILVEAVRKFFKGRIRIKPHGGYFKGKKRKDLMIIMNGKKEIIDFLSLIKLILPECIYYKLS